MVRVNCYLYGKYLSSYLVSCVRFATSRLLPCVDTYHTYVRTRLKGRNTYMYLSIYNYTCREHGTRGRRLLHPGVLDSAEN